MCPDSIPNKQLGAGLPVALFLITVLALLVAGMAQLQQSSGAAVSLQIQSQRAFFAAESGAQVGVQQVLAQWDAGAAASCPSNIADFGSAPGLASCRVEFDCSSVGSDTFRLSSSGICGTGQDRAARIVEVRLR